MSRSHRAPHTNQLRRAIQWSSLLLWGVLLSGVLLPYWPRIFPQDLFLALDPLATGAAALADRTWAPSCGYSLATLALTLLVGRFFCGWICPLGTLQDAVGWFAERTGRRIRGPAWAMRLTALVRRLLEHRGHRSWKYLILFLVLAAAAGGLQLAAFVDPVALATRGLALLGFPQVAQPVAPPPPGLAWAGRLALAVLGFTLISAWFVRRYGCRSLCPLGALLGLVTRLSPVRLVTRTTPDHARTTDCQGCSRCARVCPQGNRQDPARLDDRECIRCLRCADQCPADRIALSAAPRKKADETPTAAPAPSETRGSVDRQRRAALVGLFAGAAAGGINLTLERSRPAQAALLPPPLRPPWSLDEPEFLARCVRCGACIRVCPTGTLRAFCFEEGPLGLWTPELVPTLGGCRTDCLACALVCPTGAIRPFDRRTKFQLRAGLVRFDLHRCVAYGTPELPCSRCLEVCPTAAFELHFCLHTAERKPRAVLPERCVGCGLCEYVCVIETAGRPALVTTGTGRGTRTAL